jgi:hypothetical protein
MLFGEISAVYSENRKKHISPCGQHAEFFNVEASDKYSYISFLQSTNFSGWFLVEAET